MLPVGIHENVTISKYEKNQQGSLVIGFKQAVEIDPLAALNGGSGSTDFSQPEQDITIFPIKETGFDNTPLDQKTALTKIADIVDPLSCILKQFRTSDKVKWDLWAGTGVTHTNMATIATQPILDKVYNNIVDQFIKMMKESANPEARFRVVFVRSSKAKHYPKLRTKFLTSNPFIESMSIPKEASKIKFTDYEVKNGYSDPNPVGNSQTVSAEDGQAANSLFN